LNLLLTILIFGCVPGKQNDTRTVKIGLGHGPSHSFTKAFEKFEKKIEERSNGRYDVEIYHSGQMGGENEMQEMLTIGSLEMTVTGVINTYEPLFSVFEMPYLYRSREHVLKVNNSEIMDDVAESLTRYGIKLIGFYENGYRNISNSVRLIKIPEDMEGLMIRTPENAAQILTMKALGASPTPMPFSELYTALAQGVVDGQENPLQNIWYGRLYEVQNHIAITHHIYNSGYVLISYKFWNKLSQSDQELFRKCLYETTLWQLDYMKDLDRELEQKMKEQGVKFTYPDREAFKKATRSAYDKLYQKLGDKARKIVKQIRNIKISGKEPHKE
jgi:tripartite ATP-independent transporter DctP family solute receptor